jgi:hypothetical protein
MPYKYRQHLVLRIIFAIAILIALVATSCQAVKPYQRAFLNDENMQTGKQAIEKFSGNMHTYREAASGGSKGKTSGGCGCN